MSGKRKDYVKGNVNVALGGSFQELADSEEGPRGAAGSTHWSRLCVVCAKP